VAKAGQPACWRRRFQEIVCKPTAGTGRAGAAARVVRRWPVLRRL